MIELGVGVDIENISRFEEILRSQKVFIERFFTTKEIELCHQSENPSKCFAGRFCAKEAAVKALYDLGIKAPDFKKIEVFSDENGCPKINISSEIDVRVLKVSISHTDDIAIAFVVAYR